MAKPKKSALMPRPDDAAIVSEQMKANRPKAWAKGRKKLVDDAKAAQEARQAQADAAKAQGANGGGE